MSTTKVRSALVTLLQNSAIIDFGKTAFENVVFTPPLNGVWYSFFFVPDEPQVATLGTTGEDRMEGYIQIDINVPLNSGEKAANDIVDQLRNLFTAGRKALYQGQEVAVRSCGRSNGRIVDTSFRVSVTVRFYANINRQLQ